MEYEKLNHIEEMLAYQEQQIHDLNEIVTQQWNMIDALGKRLSRIQDKLEVESGDGISNAQPKCGAGALLDFVARNKPPHY